MNVGGLQSKCGGKERHRYGSAQSCCNGMAGRDGWGGVPFGLKDVWQPSGEFQDRLAEQEEGYKSQGRL